MQSADDDDETLEPHAGVDAHADEIDDVDVVPEALEWIPAIERPLMEMRAMSKLSSAVCVAGLLMAPAAALAHHSAAMFETEKTVTVSGTVEEFAYVNPHAWLYVVVTDDNGTPGNAADDFNATYSSGDANSNGQLDVGETWTYTATRTVVAGQTTRSGKATGTASLAFTGTDFANATGKVTAQLAGAAPAGTDVASLSGEVAITADHGLFQIQRANLQTAATTLTASGQFSIEQPASNLRVALSSTDASELQRLLISSGALSDMEEQFRTYGINLGGKLAFNDTLTGALKDPIVNGHAELGSLNINQRDLGSLTANISSTSTETRVSEGRLAQASGGGAQFSLVVPRAGENNASIDATLDRMNLGNLVVALPFTMVFIGLSERSYRVAAVAATMLLSWLLTLRLIPLLPLRLGLWTWLPVVLTVAAFFALLRRVLGPNRTAPPGTASKSF